MEKEKRSEQKKIKISSLNNKNLTESIKYKYPSITSFHVF